MDLVSRVKNIIVDPANEWRVIEGEPDSPGDILKNYVAILAAIPAVCSFIGTSIIGIGPYRTGIVAGLISAVVGYVLTLIGVYIVALVIDILADKFGGRKNFNAAFKVAAYAPTAAWVASVFTAIPVLSILSVLGLYSFYLFYLGLPALMKTPQDKAVGYVLAVIVCVIILWMLILFIPGMLIGVRMAM
jgi:hypothetical protein